jgi:kynureninase
MEAIAKAARSVGANVGFDLAHAVGNVDLHLHDWDADFAVWCSYKYLNSSPGAIAGLFVHERHANRPDLIRLAGWWGNDESTRFAMEHGFKPTFGADGWQLSNAQILPMAVHKAALDIFMEAGLEALWRKRDALTAFLERLIDEVSQRFPQVSIITPRDPAQRGAQLSVAFAEHGRRVFEALHARGIIVDWRLPNAIRVAPVPLYNTFDDVYAFGCALHEVCCEVYV